MWGKILSSIPLLARPILPKLTAGLVLSMNLARREMSVVLASLFLKYEAYHGQKGPTLELYDTQRARDIDANSDYIIPVPAKGSQGLRVRIRN